MNYKYFIFLNFAFFASCSQSSNIVSSTDVLASPKLIKTKHPKLDSINEIIIPSPIKNKLLSKPDENVPKTTKKGTDLFLF